MDDATHQAPPPGLVLRSLPALRRALALLRARGARRRGARLAVVPHVRLGAALGRPCGERGAAALSKG